METDAYLQLLIEQNEVSLVCNIFTLAVGVQIFTSAALCMCVCVYVLFSFLIPSKYHFHRCLQQETDFKSQGVLSCWCVQVQTFTVFCPVHMDWYKHVINFDTRGSGCEAILPVC